MRWFFRLPIITDMCLSQCGRRKEIEFQNHLVQLLGRPRPLGSKQPFCEAEEVQKSSLPSHSVATGTDLQGLAPRGGTKALPKRRLPGGLFRPSGVSPTGPVKQSVTQIRDTGPEYPPTRELSLNHFNKENRENRIATGSYATFVPPFRQTPEELPSVPQPLSFAKAWIVNGARATLSSTCFCCGQSHCHCLLSRPSGSGCSAASFFRQMFDGARGPDLLLPEQAVD